MTSKTYVKASTMFAAALGLALSFGAAPVQAHCAGKHTGDHRHCGGGDSIVYTAELTDGAFVFSAVDVTPNQRENQLRSNDNDDLQFDIDFNSNAPGTWDQVFNDCPGLLKLNSVDAFSVGDDDWTRSTRKSHSSSG